MILKDGTVPKTAISMKRMEYLNHLKSILKIVYIPRPKHSWNQDLDATFTSSNNTARNIAIIFLRSRARVLQPLAVTGLEGPNAVEGNRPPILEFKLFQKT